MSILFATGIVMATFFAMEGVAWLAILNAWRHVVLS